MEIEIAWWPAEDDHSEEASILMRALLHSRSARKEWEQVLLSLCA
jgi:hypothetical protein